MLSGAKPHNVTFHLHLQQCLCLSLVCQSLHWVNTSLWQLLHTFFSSSDSLSMTPWHLACCLPAGDTVGVDREDIGDHLRASITHTYTYLHTQAHREGKLLWRKGTGDHPGASITSHTYCINTRRQALLVQRRVTDDHLRAPITSHNFAHTHTHADLAFPSRRFFPFQWNTHLGGQMPSWRTQCQLGKHSSLHVSPPAWTAAKKPWRGGDGGGGGVRGLLLSHVRVSGEYRCYSWFSGVVVCC